MFHKRIAIRIIALERNIEFKPSISFINNFSAASINEFLDFYIIRSKFNYHHQFPIGIIIVPITLRPVIYKSGFPFNGAIGMISLEIPRFFPIHIRSFKNGSAIKIKICKRTDILTACWIKTCYPFNALEFTVPINQIIIAVKIKAHQVLSRFFKKNRVPVLTKRVQEKYHQEKNTVPYFHYF